MKYSSYTIACNMGFYIRKSFKIGPLRLNLSRSGLGYSVGVKGARIGVGPRGRYIHVGRGGLYYRQSLDASQPHLPSFKPARETSDGMQEIESGDVGEMVDDSSKDLLDELNRVQARTDLFPIVLIASIVLGILLLPTATETPWMHLLFIIVAVPLLLYIRHLDVTKGTAVLNYDLEKDATKLFNALKESFSEFGKCAAHWHIEAQGESGDWKRSGGANSSVRRQSIRCSLTKPRRVVCNIDPPALPAGKQTLYFFPERILVYDKHKVGAVSYDDLHIELSKTRFIESQSVPADAEIVDTTWQYINKKGGPDRRFSNNRELPVVLYGEMKLSSSNGLNEMFEYSVPDAPLKFANALQAMKAIPQ